MTAIFWVVLAGTIAVGTVVLVGLRLILRGGRNV